MGRRNVDETGLEELGYGPQLRCSELRAGTLEDEIS